MITQESKDFLKQVYDLSIPSTLPQPVGYNILVLPLCARKKVGSIFIPDSSEEKSRLASIVALVLAVGPDAYDHERYPNGPWCQVGDFVLLDRDAGNKFTVLEDLEELKTAQEAFLQAAYGKSTGKIGLRLIADDQIKAKLNSFEDIARVELKL